MGQFNGFRFTSRGLTLHSKVQTGDLLQFTRIAVGDGALGSTDPVTLNGLISQKKSLPITKLESLGGGRSVVGTSLTNGDVTTGFWLREIGLFAQDPDVGEVLYCYANAGTMADWIPPGLGGGQDLIEQAMNIESVTGNASNVSAIIDQSLVFATASQLGNLSQLQTTAKTSAVAAINELFTSASNGKSAVATAITGKGVTASGSDSYATLSTKIGNIAKDTTALAPHLLYNKTMYAGGVKVTGTMPELTGVRVAQGVGKWADNALAVYPEKGFQKGGAGDGEIKVSASQLASVLSPVNGVAPVWWGGWGGGENVIGVTPPRGYFDGSTAVKTSMIHRSAENGHMPALERTVWQGDRVFLRPPAGYYDGGSWVTTPASGLRPENLVLDADVLGVRGTRRPWNGEKRYRGDLAITSASSLNASNQVEVQYASGWFGVETNAYSFVNISNLGWTPGLIVLERAGNDAISVVFTLNHTQRSNTNGSFYGHIVSGTDSRWFKRSLSVDIYPASQGPVYGGFSIPIPIAAGTGIRWYAFEEY